jgi:hypothetical protein
MPRILGICVVALQRICNFISILSRTGMKANIFIHQAHSSKSSLKNPGNRWMVL